MSRLSILVPTHRDDLPSYARILQACSCAGPDVEVVIRDNSGSAEKRGRLERVRQENCNIAFAPACGRRENYLETLRLAKGEFALFFADDDFCFERTVAALPEIIAGIAGDASVAGISGIWTLESVHRSAVMNFQNLEHSDPATRVADYLSYKGPNVLFYSVVRRRLFQKSLELIASMPFALPFHERLACLYWLTSGKFIKIKRLLYLYECGEAETAERPVKDAVFYAAAGLDPALDRLHWFLCGFEGAALVKSAAVIPGYTDAQRQAVADRWFAVMFQRFRAGGRPNFESRLGGEADRLCERLKASAGRFSFQDMLNDVCNFIALSSKDAASRYHDFWMPILARRNAAAE
jgi:hypothetical protein